MQTSAESAAVLDTVLPVWPFPLSAPSDPVSVARAEERGQEWARRFRLIGPADDAHPLVQLRSAELVGYGYPRADTAVRTLITQWAMWYFHLDDHFEDGPAGASARHAAEAVGPLRELLTAADGGRPVADTGDPVHASLADLLRRTGEVMAPVQFRGLLTHLEGYFGSLVTESSYRERGVLPDVDSYVALRRDTGPVLPLLDLVEQAESVRLPARFYGCPEYTDMIGPAADIASWINDVFSVSKELHRADAYNLVVLLHRTGPMSLEEAATAAMDRIRQRLDVFHRARRRVEDQHGDGAFTDTELAAIRGWATGLLEFQHHGAWYLRHARYGRATADSGVRA